MKPLIRAIRNPSIIVPFMVLAVFAGLYSWMVLLRHAQFQSHAFDLSIFDQAIWNYSNFRAPESTLRGFNNLLGDHFHPILVLAAPFYWVWNNANTLLLIQVALFVGSAIPVYLLAKKRLGLISALCWTIMYLLFWGVQNAIQYDFHEIAFAMPLISASIYLFLEKHYRAAALVAATLVLVKEDLSLLVAMYGVLFLVYRRWKEGIALIALGVSWFLVITKLVMPWIAGGKKYGYWSFFQFGVDPLDALKNIIRHPKLLATVLLQPLDKRITLGFIFAPFGYLFVLSPVAILALPVLAERFYSLNYIYWFKDFHYSATVAPILTMASIDGLYRLSQVLRIKHVIAIPISLILLAIALRDAPQYPLYANLTNPAFRHVSTSMEHGNDMVKLIPSNASVVAQDSISPHLAHRRLLYELYPNAPLTDYIAANIDLVHFPTSDADYRTYLQSLHDKDYGIIYSQDGWLLFKAKSNDTVSLSPRIQVFLQK